MAKDVAEIGLPGVLGEMEMSILDSQGGLRKPGD